MLPIWSENSGSLASWSCLEICSIHATQYLVYSVSACLVGRKDFKIVGLLIYYYNIPFDGVKRRFGSLSSTLITDKNIDWLNWIWKRMLIGYEFSIFCRSLTTTCLFRMINYSPRRGSGFVKLTSLKIGMGVQRHPSFLANGWEEPCLAKFIIINHGNKYGWLVAQVNYGGW